MWIAERADGGDGGGSGAPEGCRRVDDEVNVAAGPAGTVLCRAEELVNAVCNVVVGADGWSDFTTPLGLLL